MTGEVKATVGFCIGGDCISAWPTGGGGSSPWTESGDDISRASGKVGIGTDSPTKLMHVSGGTLNVETSNGMLELGIHGGANTAGWAGFSAQEPGKGIVFGVTKDAGSWWGPMALRAAGVGLVNEVILASHTFVATAAAVHFNGATPVLVKAWSFKIWPA